MKVKIGDVKNNLQGFQQVADLAAEADSLMLGKLDIDFSTCRFFDANMAAVLGAAIAKIRFNLNEVRITNVEEKVERILSKNLFLTSFGYPPAVDSNRTTLPFQQMKSSDMTGFSLYLSQYLPGKGIPRMTPLLQKAFFKNLFEIFWNCHYHSRSPLGVFVCGQFFPKRKRLDLTISDAGVGIRTNVREFLGNRISSVEAIGWALKQGNSTRGKGHPGGIGLKLLRHFIQKNTGKIQIVSRYGFYELSDGTEKYMKMTADLPGTTVNIEINTADTTNYYLKSELTPANVF